MRTTLLPPNTKSSCDATTLITAHQVGHIKWERVIRPLMCVERETGPDTLQRDCKAPCSQTCPLSQSERAGWAGGEGKSSCYPITKADSTLLARPGTSTCGSGCKLGLGGEQKKSLIKYRSPSKGRRRHSDLYFREAHRGISKLLLFVFFSATKVSWRCLDL